MPACGGKASRCRRLRVCRLGQPEDGELPDRFARRRRPSRPCRLADVAAGGKIARNDERRERACDCERVSSAVFPRSVIAWRLMSNGWWPTLNPGACARRDAVAVLTEAMEEARQVRRSRVRPRGYNACAEAERRRGRLRSGQNTRADRRHRRRSCGVRASEGSHHAT